MAGGNGRSVAGKEAGFRKEERSSILCLEAIEQDPRKKMHNAGPASNYEDDKKLRVVQSQKNLGLFLNAHAFRVMAVLDPLKVVLTNFPEGEVEQMEAVNNPEDESMGKREIPFSRVLYIEREDFREEAPPKFFRLAPGKEVRFKFAYYLTCTGVVKDDRGEIAEVRCTYDPATRGGDNPPVGGSEVGVVSRDRDRRNAAWHAAGQGGAVLGECRRRERGYDGRDERRCLSRALQTSHGRPLSSDMSDDLNLGPDSSNVTTRRPRNVPGVARDPGCVTTLVDWPEIFLAGTWLVPR